MSENISLTIPNTPTAIAAAVAFFSALNGSLPAKAAAVEPLCATGPSSAPTDEEESGTGSAGSSAEVDTKGVAFDVNFCSRAADPFYSSGPRAGQWKKRKGVDDAAYDKWYEDRLLDLAPAGELKEQSDDEDNTAPVNTGAAFGNHQQASASKPAPQNAGEFMGWVSEKQAAGVLKQEQIQAAYSMAGIGVADLFKPDVAAVGQAVATLYGILSSQVGA